MKYLLLFCLAIAPSARANRPDIAVHFGVSFTATTLAYMALNSRTHNQPKSLLWAATGCLIAGTLKELVVDKKLDGTDMISNALGTGLAAGAIVTFEF